MKRNVGKMDRIIRMLIGITGIYLALYPAPYLSNEILRVFIGVFGVGNLMVSMIKFCPLYTLADISTHKDPR